MNFVDDNNLTIRPVVHKEVNKMIKCKTPALSWQRKVFL